MKNILFNKSNLYSSKYTLEEMQGRLEELSNGRQGIYGRFGGKIKLPIFYLTPILGVQRNLKVVISGKIIDNNDIRVVELNFTLEPILNFFVYGIPTLFYIIFAVNKFTNISLEFIGFKQADYLIIIFPSIFFLICLITFWYQVSTYSKMLINLLKLELIDSIYPPPVPKRG